MCAASSQATALSIARSKSSANRRHRPSQAKALSMTYRRGSSSKPTASHSAYSRHWRVPPGEKATEVISRECPVMDMISTAPALSARAMLLLAGSTSKVRTRQRVAQICCSRLVMILPPKDAKPSHSVHGPPSHRVFDFCKPTAALAEQVILTVGRQSMSLTSKHCTRRSSPLSGNFGG